MFVQVQTSEQTLFYFLILRKSRFHQKKFYSIIPRAQVVLLHDQSNNTENVLFFTIA